MRLTNRTTIIAGIVIIIVVGGIYASLTGLPYKRSQIASEVREYLVHTRAYPAADIQEVRGVYSFKSGDYEVEVRYKDEPNQNYTYAKVDGAFRLVGASSLYGNHMDETFY
ncbi:hypothetical protein C173_14505 [Paenibacillus sp. FSL R7-277]|uniref:DUF3139 domain-containing protein n=1 Tax=unclassified Paenibacillus TaxID=185978 RepID=UPI0003E1FCCA|nr:DUF3139 domain-containing protein [Paenibacillus sp. FSL R7-277]ETT72258.1 hypothetical protein C173_14505 [Paenibacillus sp. FSL R7-277]